MNGGSLSGIGLSIRLVCRQADKAAKERTRIAGEIIGGCPWFPSSEFLLI